MREQQLVQEEGRRKLERDRREEGELLRFRRGGRFGTYYGPPPEIQIISKIKKRKNYWDGYLILIFQELLDDAAN